MEKEITLKVKDEKVKEEPELTHTEEDLQQKLFIYQLLERQMEALKEQMQLIEQRVFKIKNTREAVENIKAEDNDVVVPLGSGIYSKGSLNGKEIIIDIGSGIMITGSKATAKKHIDEIYKQFKTSHKEVENQLVAVIEKINEIALEVQAISKQMQGSEEEEEKP